MNKENAFTLVEVLIAVVLLGILAAVALPQYSKSIRKGHERDAIIQLTAIHASNEIYKASGRTYYSSSGSTEPIETINDEFDLSIIPNGMIYSYVSADGSSYEATAEWAEAGANDYTIMVVGQNLGATNPCCSDGTCPTLPACP